MFGFQFPSPKVFSGKTFTEKVVATTTLPNSISYFAFWPHFQLPFSELIFFFCGFCLFMGLSGLMNSLLQAKQKDSIRGLVGQIKRTEKNQEKSGPDLIALALFFIQFSRVGSFLLKVKWWFEWDVLRLNQIK